MDLAKLQPRWTRTVEILVWVAAVGVLAENIALYRQNRRLQETAAPQVAERTRLRMLAGLTLDGRIEPVNVPAAGSKLLILTFSPGCPACQANQEGWAKLASTVGQKGMRVLWLSRDPIDITRDYCLKHGIPLSDTLADPPYRTYLKLGLARVPNTVLVGAGGMVEKVWPGRLDLAGWNSVYAYFGERQDAASAAQNAVDLITTGCGPGTGDSSKNCK